MDTVLPAEPASAGLARRLVVDELHRVGCESRSDVAELLVSELVTNAVIHARTAISLRVGASEGFCRVEVADSSPALVPSQPRPNGPEETTGRGLVLVDMLAERWGQDEGDDGKVVWFELARKSA